MPNPKTIFGRIWITLLVMAYALRPPRQEGAKPAMRCYLSVPGDALQITAHELPYYLADLARGLSRGGELLLLFVGCLAPAAPLLLFRLKRTGFANCRVTVLPEGLLLQATR